MYESKKEKKMFKQIKCPSVLSCPSLILLFVVLSPIPCITQFYTNCIKETGYDCCINSNTLRSSTLSKRKSENAFRL